MAVPPIPATPAVSSIAQSASAPAKVSSGDSPFSNVFSKLLSEANGQQIASEQAIEQLANGQTDSIHDVVISVAKAELSFRLVLEIRNRLIEAYQEIMRMQV